MRDNALSTCDSRYSHWHLGEAEVGEQFPVLDHVHPRLVVQKYMVVEQVGLAFRRHEASSREKIFIAVRFIHVKVAIVIRITIDGEIWGSMGRKCVGFEDLFLVVRLRCRKTGLIVRLLWTRFKTIRSSPIRLFSVYGGV